ncbi:hypothetical protein TNCV_897711 [Trichonephila clavipes]|nr:hypothetical protein TNCV_897711 [Trichonephila clavipes]
MVIRVSAHMISQMRSTFLSVVEGGHPVVMSVVFGVCATFMKTLMPLVHSRFSHGIAFLILTSASRESQKVTRFVSFQNPTNEDFALSEMIYR